MDLEVEVSGLSFKNPVIVASAGYSEDANGLERLIKRGYGGVVTKSVSKNPMAGAPPPRVFWYNPYERTWVDGAEAHRNGGIERMAKSLASVKGFAEKEKCHIIGSIAVKGIEESVEVAQEFDKAGVSAIEMDMVCMNVGEHLGSDRKEEGAYWGDGKHPERAIELIKAVKAAVDVPVWPKINPTVLFLVGDRITAESKPDAYTWGGSVFPNRPVGLAIDIDSGRPIFSGNNLLKIEKKMKFTPSAHGFPFWPATVLSTVMIRRKIPNVSLAPSGGIRRGFEALQVLMAGANAVEVCTAVYRDMNIVDSILREMQWALSKKGCENLREIIGVSAQQVPVELIDLPLPSF